jgi:lipopolysaccharide/colanic/teichoic acid biosynthesis glycosyltransferase
MSVLECVPPVIQQDERRHKNCNNSPADCERSQRALLQFPSQIAQTDVGAWVNSRSRRVLDCLVAIVVLLTLAPLFLLLALLVRLSSPGPVFFRQSRMGRYGVEFTLFKFRSMRVTDASGSPITVIGDARVTRIGALLRRFKLDELPQFWNVLIGDMSLVGPRPKLAHHEALFLLARPGITGAATLAFRQEEEVLAGIPRHQLDAFYQEVVKPSKAWIDMEYLSNATLGSDLRLLSDTCASCFGVSRRRSTEEWIAIYLEMKAESALPADRKLSA